MVNYRNKSFVVFDHPVKRHGIIADMPLKAKLKEGYAFSITIDITQDRDKMAAALRNLATILEEVSSEVWIEDLGDNNSGMIIEGSEYFHYKRNSGNED